MTFTYTAFDRAGKRVAASVSADTLVAAKEQLHRQSLFVASIKPGGSADAGSALPTVGTATASAGKRIGVGRRLKCVSMFARQLHVLVGSGTPLAQSLSAIVRQTTDPDFRAALEIVHRRIGEGAPLSEAMRQCPQFFDATCQSLAAAGEASGNMSAMLQRLADLTRKQLVTRQMVIGSLIYPCLLIVIGINVLLMMLLFVLPRFEGLFEQLDTPLPPTTTALIWMSQTLKGYWWAILPTFAGLVGGSWAWFRSVSGRASVDRNLLNVPKVGVLIRSVMTARLARTLGTLLESKVPLLESLQLTRQSLPNQQYVVLMERAERMVGEGEPVSSVLSQSDLLSACVQEAVRNGEQSGRIGEPLIQMASFLEEENELIIKSITRLLEPLILTALGVLVGFIAVSMFMPLFDLVASASGGGGH